MSMSEEENKDECLRDVASMTKECWPPSHLNAVAQKSIEGSPSAFDTPRGARLRPGKPEDDAN